MKIARPRLIVYIITLILIAGVYISCYEIYPSQDLLNLRLTQVYGFVSLFYLLISLYISPIYNVFKNIPGKANAILARRAIGVSGWVLALLHSAISFFTILGGFGGFPFLSSSFQFSLYLGLVALLILSALAITSFDFAVKKMGHYWKWLHRLSYVSTVLIVLHVTLIGSNFQTFSDSLAILFYLLTYVWLVLEVIRIDQRINKKLGVNHWWGIATVCTVIISIIGFILYSQNPTTANTFSVHSGHIISINSQLLSSLNPKVVAKLGNPNIVFHAIFDGDLTPTAGKSTSLSFRIKNDSEQNQVDDQAAINDDRISLSIINKELTQFDIITPSYQDGRYTFPYTFTQDDTYHLLLTYQPVNGIEQFFDYAVDVGTPKKSSNPDLTLTPDQTAKIGDYDLSLNVQGTLNQINLNAGNTNLILNLSKNNPTIADPTKLKVTMINAQTSQFVHLLSSDDHNPSSQIFTPYAIKDKQTSGVYKLFIQVGDTSQKSQQILTIKVD
jgi:DMSO/TMAO reductase YedYZ heme-binding membrane subunit